ncbi:hypothetical protein OF83DRAFT_1137751 [Amylostereum chailletii]|nr:hypothetical protein OF83DRAFT_1137751 [Amylostereum chailletii]
MMVHVDSPNVHKDTAPLPPISRLPAELLLDIISRLPNNVSRRCYNDPTFSRVVVSQVCRLWRDAADQTKGLWTFVPLNNPMSATHALACSDALPLQLLIRRDAGADLETVRNALRQISRVKELTWVVRRTKEGMDEFDMQVMALLSEEAAPALETLDLEFDDPMSFEEDLPDVPATLFSEPVPSSLRHLSVYGRRLPRNSTLLQAHLTSLVLNECTAWETIDDAMDTFQRMPHLESFTARGDVHTVLALGSENIVTPLEPRSVSLSSMQSFSIKAAVPQIVMLLRYLRLPTRCALHIASNDYQIVDHADHLDDLALELSFHYESAQAAGETFQTQMWRHRGDEMTVISLRAWNLASSPPSDTGPLLPQHTYAHTLPVILHINIEWDVTTSVLEFDATQFLIDNVPVLGGAHTLAICRHHGSNVDIIDQFCSESLSDWRSVFGDLQQVKALQVEDNSASHILRILGEPLSLDLPEPLFPNLQSITFFDVSFQDRLWESEEWKSSLTLFEGLSVGLDERLLSGVLKRVSIRKCDFDVTMAEALRARWGKEVLDWDEEIYGSERSARMRMAANAFPGDQPEK